MSQKLNAHDHEVDFARIFALDEGEAIKKFKQSKFRYSRQHMLVNAVLLAPPVHCGQKCIFCSPERMLQDFREVARSHGHGLELEID